MIKQHLRAWALFLLLLVAVWLDRVWPLTDQPLYRCEPISLTAILVSLAFSAASFAVNRLLGQKPPKVTKGQQSGELFLQNADEGSPVAEIFGGAPGGAATTRTVTWTNLVNSRVNTDGSLEKIAGDNDCGEDVFGPGDGGAWSVEQITSTGGDWEVSFTFGPNPSGRTFCGLTDAGFDLNPANWDYIFHVSTENNTIDPHPPNSVFVYEQGSITGPKAFLDGVWQTGDTLRIRSIGGVITYYWRDTLMYTSDRVPNYPMRLIASIACLNKTVNGAVIAQSQTDVLSGVKTAGTIIWCKEPRKVVTTEKKGGKGAPKQTVETITYYCDLAILFAKGRQRIKKLFANSDLIIDLDAPIGASTGGLDSGVGASSPYSTNSPPTPATTSGGPLSWSSRLASDKNGTISGSTGAGGASMRFYEGNYDQLPDALLEADVGVGNDPAYRGWAYLVIENFNISKYGGVPTFLATLENADFQDLEEIANHLCERVDIDPGDRDFSQFAGQTVRGLIVQEPQAPRQTLEIAAIPYKAEFYETVDGRLTGTYLGGASVATIDPNDLGMQDGDAVELNGEMGNKLEFGLVVDDQLPRQISVTAFDPGKNHETTTQHAYRFTGFAQRVEQQALPMTLLPDEARQSAERLLYQAHVERESASLRLPWKYAWINPTDIVTLVSAGITHKLRWQGIAGAVPGLLEVQAAADETDVYNQTISTCSPSGGSEAIRWTCVTNFDVDGNNLTATVDQVRNFAPTIYTAYAQSEQVMEGPGDYVQWRFLTPKAEMAIALSGSDCPTCVPNLTYPPYCQFDFLEATDWFFVFTGGLFYLCGDDASWGVGEENFDIVESNCFNPGVPGDPVFTSDTVFKLLWNADNKIEYYVDDVLVFTSTFDAQEFGTIRLVAVAGALELIDETNAEPGILDAMIYHAPTTPGVQDVVWECTTLFNVTGNDIIATLAGANDGFFTAWAQSKQILTGRGDYFQFRQPTPGSEFAIGVTAVNCPTCFPDPPQCIFFLANITDYVYVYYAPDFLTDDPEWGVGEGVFSAVEQGLYDENTVFKLLWNDDDKIEFYADGVLQFTSTFTAQVGWRLAVDAGGTEDGAGLVQPSVADAVYFDASAGLACGVFTPPTIPAPAQSLAFLLDTVMLRDSDDAAGYYVGIVPRSSDAWSGAALYRDRGAGYELVDTFIAPATGGVLVTAVTPTNVTTFDETTVVTVDLYGTAALESATELQVLNGANAALLGEAMIFQYKTATQVGGFPNRWQLTGLLWGRRGSDFALGTFAIGSRFMVLDGAVKFIDTELAERGLARTFKAVTNGFGLDDTAATSFTWNARTLMPLSVVDVMGSRDMSSNLTVTWKRRTRIGGYWADGQDVPLGEFEEKYEVDVMSGSTVKRTITVTAETASYSAADQTTDFGSPQSSITLKIYQISNTVGRGFVRTATV